MARNVEKSQNVLNRLLAARTADDRPQRARRPRLASECDDVTEADRWRATIMREIGRKVMDIQNAGLGEGRLRDLNDDINKLIREKAHWEKRIVELGGPDYAAAAPPVGGKGGAGASAATGKGAGYRYFGAARELPGVKGLLAPTDAPARARRRTRAALLAGIDGDYYGYRDEEGGALVAAEAAAEPARAARVEAEWRSRQGTAAGAPAPASTAPRPPPPAGTAAAAHDDDGDDGAMDVDAVALPDAASIEAAVVARKKAALLAKYASPALIAEQDRAAEMLGRREGG